MGCRKNPVVGRGREIRHHHALAIVRHITHLASLYIARIDFSVDAQMYE